MLGEIIRLLIAAACGLFVLSLPLSKTETGATLRRLAGLCFVLAFLPSIVCSLYYLPTDPAGTSTATSTATPSATTPIIHVLSGLGCVALIVLAAAIAYAILKLRSRFFAKAKPRDPWESFFNRGGGKRPFTMNPHAPRSRGPFSDADEEGD